MTRNDLVDVVREAGEVVEQALPVGSSVLKDQLALMITAELMREKAMSPLFPPFPPPELVKMDRETEERRVALGLTKLAMERDKESVWETYCYFVIQLHGLRRPQVTEEEMKQAFKDERGGGYES